MMSEITAFPWDQRMIDGKVLHHRRQYPVHPHRAVAADVELARFVGTGDLEPVILGHDRMSERNLDVELGRMPA